MKNPLLAACLAVSLGALAQQHSTELSDTKSYQARASVPARIHDHFQDNYPDASATQWSHQGRDWHVRYYDPVEARTVDSYYDRKGRREDTHILCNKVELPDGFDHDIAARFHTRDYKVYRIARPDTIILYQVLLREGGALKIIYTDEFGNIVRYHDRHDPFGN